MFRDQKFQVSSCVSKKKKKTDEFFFTDIYKKKFHFFVQVQHKYFCSVKIAKR